MENIVIERVRYDPMNSMNINSCNHPKNPEDTEIAELDYETEFKKTNLMNYAEIINYPIAWSYTFNSDEVMILTKCASDYLKNPLDGNNAQEIIDRFASSWQNGVWFFRFNSMSPKDGTPTYPVTSASDVVNKIITSKRAWNCMVEGESTIYFTKYDTDWDPRREFRVFIYRTKVTAISQYNVSIKNMLAGKSNTDAKQLASNIKKYLEEEILPKVCEKIGTDNVVCDIYVNKDMSLRIVEFNSFGYWQAAGSALYHWLDDFDKLYNTQDRTYLRFVK